MPRYLAEWYRPDLDRGQLQLAGREITDAADRLAAAGQRVELLLTVAVPADEFVFALFTAPSADSVQRVCHSAGLPMTRITEALSAPALARPSRSTWSPP